MFFVFPTIYWTWTARHKKWSLPVDCSLLEKKEKKREVYRILFAYAYKQQFLSFSIFRLFKVKAHTCARVQCTILLRNFVVYHYNLAVFSFGIKKINEIYLPGNFIRKFIYFVLLFTFLFCRFSFAFAVSFIFSTSNEWAHTGREWPYLLSIRSFITVQALRFFNFLLFHRFVYFPFSSFSPLDARDKQIFIYEDLVFLILN